MITIMKCLICNLQTCCRFFFMWTLSFEINSCFVFILLAISFEIEHTFFFVLFFIFSYTITFLDNIFYGSG